MCCVTAWIIFYNQSLLQTSLSSVDCAPPLPNKRSCCTRDYTSFPIPHKYTLVLAVTYLSRNIITKNTKLMNIQTALKCSVYRGNHIFSLTGLLSFRVQVNTSTKILVPRKALISGIARSSQTPGWKTQCIVFLKPNIILNSYQISYHTFLSNTFMAAMIGAEMTPQSPLSCVHCVRPRPRCYRIRRSGNG